MQFVGHSTARSRDWWRSRRPAHLSSMPSSLIIGVVAGVLVVLAVLFFDKIKIDDPVGATSVHLVNGVFGTLCVGLFAAGSDLPRTRPAMVCFLAAAPGY